MPREAAGLRLCAREQSRLAAGDHRKAFGVHESGSLPRLPAKGTRPSTGRTRAGAAPDTVGHAGFVDVAVHDAPGEPLDLVCLCVRPKPWSQLATQKEPARSVIAPVPLTRAELVGEPRPPSSAGWAVAGQAVALTAEEQQRRTADGQGEAR